MSYRSIVISDTALLKLHQNNLIVVKDKEETRIPLEDIATIMLDSTRSVVSTSLLSKVNEYGICVITTDDKHLPSGIMLPLNQFYSQLERTKLQLAQSEPFKKRLWQKVVQGKIENQGYCLKYCAKEKEAAYLYKLSQNVRSGDTTHQESYAARYYFKVLFEKDFTRKEKTELNAAINYGYSIIRSAIARELVSSGLLTAVGIHHRNQFNNFNLADDFIEPFRPVVDLYAAKHMFPDVVFSKHEKHRLVGLLHHEIRHNSLTTSVSNAVRETVKSYVSCLETKVTDRLILPELLPLKMHNYE